MKGRGNCNMPVVNYCVHYGMCADKNVVDDEPDFVNPFKKECTHQYTVVHNKCKNTWRNICLAKNKENQLVLSSPKKKDPHDQRF